MTDYLVLIERSRGEREGEEENVSGVVYGLV
jgi:hypothetical protein